MVDMRVGSSSCSYPNPSLLLAGTPDEIDARAGTFQAFEAVWAAAVGSWALRQPRDQGEARCSMEPGARRPREAWVSAE